MKGEQPADCLGVHHPQGTELKQSERHAPFHDFAEPASPRALQHDHVIPLAARSDPGLVRAAGEQAAVGRPHRLIPFAQQAHFSFAFSRGHQQCRARLLGLRFPRQQRLTTEGTRYLDREVSFGDALPQCRPLPQQRQDGKRRRIQRASPDAEGLKRGQR